MRKFEFANIVCEVSVTENYKMFSEVTCEYEKDTVAYAVERFFCHSSRFRRECTLESWEIRTSKGRERTHRRNQYHWCKSMESGTAFGTSLFSGNNAAKGKLKRKL